jgi:hypothetical protein
MNKNLKRALASLVLTAAASLMIIAVPGAAQAADGIRCSSWTVLSPNPGLETYTCVTRSGTSVWGWMRVKNFHTTTPYYVNSIQIDTTAGTGGLNTCSVGWLNPGQLKECSSFAVFDTGGSDFARGWINYWTGAGYVWKGVNSPSA